MVGTDYAVQCVVPEMNDQEVSNPDSDAASVTESRQQSVTVTDTSLPELDLHATTADNDDAAVSTSVNDSLSTTAVSDGSHQAILPAATEQTVQSVDASASQLTSVIPTTESTCQPPRAVSLASSAGQITGISLGTKSQGFVFCQVTNGGQTIIVPRSAVSGIHLTSGTSASSTSSITRVPVFRSVIPLSTVSSDKPAIAALTLASSTASAVVVTQASAGVLLRPAANAVRVIAGTNNAANNAGAAVVLNRGTAPQRLAVAIAPANSTLRPTGAGSVRLVFRNGTPLAVGGVRASGSAVTAPQLKLLTSAVPLAGLRPVTSVSTAVTAIASSIQVSTSTVTAMKQTAVNDVQAYLRRIEELKSSQPEQGTKAPVTLTTTVRTPLKAKTVLPSLTSAQQIVVVQSGSQPQLASISATQLVSTFVVTCYCYVLLQFDYSKLVLVTDIMVNWHCYLVPYIHRILYISWH